MYRAREKQMAQSGRVGQRRDRWGETATQLKDEVESTPPVDLQGQSEQVSFNVW